MTLALTSESNLLERLWVQDIKVFGEAVVIRVPVIALNLVWPL